MEKIIYSKSLLFQCNTHKYTDWAKIDIELTKKDDNKIVLSFVGRLFVADKEDSHGQCIDSIAKYCDDPKVKRIKEIWERYHLNDMHAGCIHQREFEKEPYKNHANAHCDICNYTYGSSWLYEEIPAEIIEEVKSW